MSAVEGMVRALARGGDSVVETDRGIVFAPGGLPGERVRLEQLRRHRGVQRAGKIRILSRSPHRVKPVCSIAVRCGGCPWMSADLEIQRQTKAGFVREAIAAGGADPEATVHQHAGVPLSYRQRARLKFRRVGRQADNQVVLGFVARSTRRIVPVGECSVLSADLSVGLAHLRELVSLLDGDGEVLLYRGKGNGCAALIRTDHPQPPGVYGNARSLVATGRLSGVSLAIGANVTPAEFGCTDEYRRGVDGLSLVGPPGGFSQAHDEVNAELVDVVRQLSQPAQGSESLRIVELYCGSGNLTIGLAQVGEVEAAELDEVAARYCRENLSIRGLKADVYALPVERFVAKLNRTKAIQTLVLDPPRSGAKPIVGEMIALGPQQIVYVSCDTETLRRDLQALVEGGYRVDRGHCFDMFPQTARVEAVVRLRKV